jgi:predicted DNA-binding protein YlxM (UPF0122 family)
MNPESPAYRYQEILSRKKEQLAETQMEIEALQKYFCRNETALIFKYNAEMKRSRLREDIQELNQVVESIETHTPLKHSIILSSNHSIISKQLNVHQRRLIEQGIADGKSNAQIAREIGVHRSTVGREIKRKTEVREDYQAEEAQHLAEVNQRMAQSLRNSRNTGMSYLTNLKKRNTDYALRRHMPLRSTYIHGKLLSESFAVDFEVRYYGRKWGFDLNNPVKVRPFSVLFGDSFGAMLFDSSLQDDSRPDSLRFTRADSVRRSCKGLVSLGTSMHRGSSLGVSIEMNTLTDPAYAVRCSFPVSYNAEKNNLSLAVRNLWEKKFFRAA